MLLVGRSGYWNDVFQVFLRLVLCGMSWERSNYSILHPIPRMEVMAISVWLAFPDSRWSILIVVVSLEESHEFLLQECK